MSGVIRRPVAVIDGQAAFVLTAILSGALRHVPPLRRLLADMRLDPVQVAATMGAYRALEEAGHAWRESRLPESGNAATSGNGDLASSELMVTSEAALLLDLTGRRVRQLAAAGDLPGVRAGGGWRFRRADVIAYRERSGAR